MTGAVRPYGLAFGFTTGGRTGSGNPYGFRNVVDAGVPTVCAGWPTTCPGTGDETAAGVASWIGPSVEYGVILFGCGGGVGGAAVRTPGVAAPAAGVPAGACLVVAGEPGELPDGAADGAMIPGMTIWSEPG